MADTTLSGGAFSGGDQGLGDVGLAGSSGALAKGASASGAGQVERPALAGPGFVHLRVRSAYSLLDGAMTVKKLAGFAAKANCVAVGISDPNLFGALEFSEALAEKGIQPIMGLTLPVSFLSQKPGAAAGPDGSLALIAQNEVGWANLMALSSLSFLEVPAGSLPHVDLQKVLDHSDGVICLTGGREGLLSRALLANLKSEADMLLRQLAKAFPNRLYIELQRHGMADEAQIEPLLIELAYQNNLPLVATNDVRFDSPERHRAQDILMCIGQATRVADDKRERVSANHCFRSEADMLTLFADLPEALANSVDIARRCAIRPLIRAPILPRFTTAEGRDEPEELASQARQGLEARLLKRPPVVAREIYDQRLEHEINVINRMGFAGYFLIVADFIKWSKENNIPVGPGRGSGAGSLVAYSLTITDLDPLAFGLLFERFLNPERVSMPDFDIDFCQEKRDKVIDYVQKKYGADRVAQIITFGTLQARAALRDVGRVLDMSYGQVDRLAKMVPNNPAAPVTLAQAIKDEPRLQEERSRDADVRTLLDAAIELEGLYRNASTHAAGVVIGDRPLHELVPLYKDPRSSLPATQFNMKWVEPAGLVKFDFLGLKTLTVIQRALDFLKARDIVVDLDTLPFDDPKTYELLASGKTMGVFQLESQGMRDTLRKMRADTLDDIIALISLYRPGPMKNIETYCDVKFGRKDADYLHESLVSVLKETQGVIIYQEQVMQIAQILSGYSLGEADLLRRAMGKKKPEEMAKQKDRFVSGATERGVDAELADRIFELVSEFAGYGFNKSHAAAYAVIAYQTAYLKANHPVEFMAASMSLDIDDTDKLGAFMQEAKSMKIKVLSPDLNYSEADFSVQDNAIRYALGGIKSVGVAAMAQVVEIRQAGGKFKSLHDLAERVDPRVLGRRTWETLSKAGAFDSIEPNRALVFASSDQLVAHANAAASDRQSAQTSLFGDSAPPPRAPLPSVKPWSAQERLDNEFAALGLFLSGHPLDDLIEALRRRQTVFFSEIHSKMQGSDAIFRMAGVVRARKERPARDGGKFAWVTLSDPTGEFEVMIMPETLNEARDYLDPGTSVSFRAKARLRDGDLKLSAEKIELLDQTDMSGCAGIKVFLARGAPIEELARVTETLRGATSSSFGELRVVVELADGREVEIQAPGRFPIDVAARRALKSASGV
ncbi:MAG: DNA polymerase III subunit alpha, partial [Hyphomonadaceae bacterium]